MLRHLPNIRPSQLDRSIHTKNNKLMSLSDLFCQRRRTQRHILPSNPLHERSFQTKIRLDCGRPAQGTAKRSGAEYHQKSVARKLHRSKQGDYLKAIDSSSFRSFSRRIAPLGLCGVLIMIILVRDVILDRTTSQSTEKSGYFKLIWTGIPPFKRITGLYES